MELLPNLLLIQAKPIFNNNKDRLAHFLALITAGSCIAKLGVTTQEPMPELDKPTKKKPKKSDDVEIEVAEEPKSNVIIKSYGIFPHKFADNNLRAMCGQYINHDIANNIELLNKPEVAIKAAAWYYISHGIFNLEHEEQIKVLDLTIKQPEFISLKRQYLNIVEVL